MARKPSALPKIPVKTERVTKRLQFDPQTVRRIELFCEYYAQREGAKPEFNDAAIALIEHSLDKNRDFLAFAAKQPSVGEK